MLPEEIIEKIEFELEEIGSLFELYKDELFNLSEEPNLMELTAFAGVLHSFYNGAEKIFLVIARNIDKKVPEGSKWHKTLLLQMTTENKARSAVLSEEMKERLLDYLAFRHFFRHTYSFRLDWEEMEDLVKPIGDVWDQFNSEISVFLESLRETE